MGIVTGLQAEPFSHLDNLRPKCRKLFADLILIIGLRSGLREALKTHKNAIEVPQVSSCLAFIQSPAHYIRAVQANVFASILTAADLRLIFEDYAYPLPDANSTTICARLRRRCRHRIPVKAH